MKLCQKLLFIPRTNENIERIHNIGHPTIRLLKGKLDSVGTSSTKCERFHAADETENLDKRCTALWIIPHNLTEIQLGKEKKILRDEREVFSLKRIQTRLTIVR